MYFKHILIQVGTINMYYLDDVKKKKKEKNKIREQNFKKKPFPGLIEPAKKQEKSIYCSEYYLVFKD